jgi:hypothetical protein
VVKDVLKHHEMNRICTGKPERGTTSRINHIMCHMASSLFALHQLRQNARPTSLRSSSSTGTICQHSKQTA